MSLLSVLLNYVCFIIVSPRLATWFIPSVKSHSPPTFTKRNSFSNYPIILLPCPNHLTNCSKSRLWHPSIHRRPSQRKAQRASAGKLCSRHRQKVIRRYYWPWAICQQWHRCTSRISVYQKVSWWTRYRVYFWYRDWLAYQGGSKMRCEGISCLSIRVRSWEEKCVVQCLGEKLGCLDIDRKSW